MLRSYFERKQVRYDEETVSNALNILKVNIDDLREIISGIKKYNKITSLLKLLPESMRVDFADYILDRLGDEFIFACSGELTEVLVMLPKHERLEFANRWKRNFRNHTEIDNVLKMLLKEVNNTEGLINVVTIFPYELRQAIVEKNMDLVKDGYDLALIISHVIHDDDAPAFVRKNKHKIENVPQLLLVLNKIIFFEPMLKTAMECVSVIKDEKDFNILVQQDLLIIPNDYISSLREAWENYNTSRDKCSSDDYETNSDGDSDDTLLSPSNKKHVRFFTQCHSEALKHESKKNNETIELKPILRRKHG